MTHFLLSTLITGSLDSRLSSSLCLFMIVFCDTARTTFELDTTALPLEASSCTRSGACRRTRSPTTHSLASLHPGSGAQGMAFFLVAAEGRVCGSSVVIVWIVQSVSGFAPSDRVAISVCAGLFDRRTGFGECQNLIFWKDLISRVFTEATVGVQLKRTTELKLNTKSSTRTSICVHLILCSRSAGKA